MTSISTIERLRRLELCLLTFGDTLRNHSQMGSIVQLCLPCLARKSGIKFLVAGSRVILNAIESNGAFRV